MVPSAQQQVSHAIREVRNRLRAAGVDSADAEARALVSFAARADRSLILLDSVPDDFDSVLDQAVSRREGHEPLQLILGRAAFRRVTLEVRPGVFIPRPETEVGIDAVHDWCSATGRKASDSLIAIDACCGSGTLAAGILDEFPGARVHAFDVNPDAVELTRRNLARVVKDPARVSVAEAALRADGDGEQSGDDVLDTVGAPRPAYRAGAVDLVVSNPPYIPSCSIPRQREVLDYDPYEALFGGGEDGMKIPGAVVAFAGGVLTDGGLLVMEHADVQGATTRALAESSGLFSGVRTIQDLTGRDRFLVAVRARGDSE